MNMTITPKSIQSDAISVIVFRILHGHPCASNNGSNSGRHGCRGMSGMQKRYGSMGLAENEKARDRRPGPSGFCVVNADQWPNQLNRQISSVEIVCVYFLESMLNPAAPGPASGTFAQSKLE